MKKKFETQPVFAYECSLCDIRPFDEVTGNYSSRGLCSVICTGNFFFFHISPHTCLHKNIVFENKTVSEQCV